MNINFISKPIIFKIGQTRLDYDGVSDFIEFLEEESGKSPIMIEKMLHVDNRINDVDKMSEIAGRVCYQSYYAGRESEDYIEHIKEDQHGNVFEHPTVNFVLTGVSRSLTHELIRHRVGTAISEMSQRFVGANEKSGQWNFIVPAALREFFQFDDVKNRLLVEAENAVESYEKMKTYLSNVIDEDEPNRKKKILEAARELLPNWIETRGVWSINMRTARHILDKRGSEHADAQIREFSVELLDVLQKMDTLVLNDITNNGGNVELKYSNV